jgi:hypothetical protein
MTTPPKLDLTLAEAHAFIEKMEHVTISLQTVYNWTEHGKRGQVLRTKVKAGQKFTTQAWIREFLDAIR